MVKKVEKNGKSFNSLWNKWNITQELIDGIKAGNQDCVSAFYFEKDNHNHLKRFVYNVIQRYEKILRGQFQDAMQTIYIDLPLFDFSTEKTFNSSLLDSIRLTPFGGLTLVKEQDKKYMCSSYRLCLIPIEYICYGGHNRHKDDEHDFSLLSLSDYATKSVEDTYFKDVEDVPPYLLDLIKEFLTPKQFEHFKLRLLGYDNITIQNELNCTCSTAGFNYSSGRQALIRHYKDIIKTMYKKGVLSDRYLNLIPDDYQHCCDLYEKQQERNRLASRKNYRKRIEERLVLSI